MQNSVSRAFRQRKNGSFAAFGSDLFGDAGSGEEHLATVDGHINGLQIKRRLVEIDALGEEKPVQQWHQFSARDGAVCLQNDGKPTMAKLRLRGRFEGAHGSQRAILEFTVR